MTDSTLDIITAEMGKLLFPLESAVSDFHNAKNMINVLGWELPPGVDHMGFASINIQHLIDKIELVFQSTPEEQNNQLLMASRYTELLVAIGEFFQAVRAMAEAIPSVTGMTSDYLSKTGIAERLSRRLLDLLIISYIEQHYYVSFTVLELVGIFERTQVEADPATYQTKHIRHEIRYDRIGDLFTDPGSLMEDVYGWGTQDFNAEALLMKIASFLEANGSEVRLQDLSQRIEEELLGRPVPEAQTDPMPQAWLSVLKGFGWDELAAGFTAFGLRATNATGTDGGIGIFPFAKGAQEFSFPLCSDWFFQIETSLDMQGSIILQLRPNQPIDVQFNMVSEGGADAVHTGRILLKLSYGSDETESFQMLSIPGGCYLEAKEVHFGGGAGLVKADSFDLLFEGGIVGAQFVFAPSEGDGFITKLIPSEGFNAGFDLIVGWSRLQGLYFQGSSSLEVKLPVHVSVGPIDVKDICIRITVGEDGDVPIELTSSVSAHLGPLTAIVESIGLKVGFAFPDSGGNLGPIALDLGFKPPRGVGLAIDASTVKGGGYLSFDFDKEQYTGFLELVFNDFLTLKAVGLITTKMPDGSKGFSLLIIVTAEFGSTGYQLGYGFTLLGVGGLLGLNRTMKLEPLMEGVRTGAITSVMFPENMVENAPKIISDLRKYFPPQVEVFLIGPMAKLGWGTPALITVSLSVVMEIPGNIAILGVLRVVLPDAKAPLLKLQVNFFGAIEFDKKQLYFFAAMFESRVLLLTIEGEMGLLVAWGKPANFIVSVGGFHPQFTPPPLPFPSPKRVSFNILNESWGRIRVMGYFAITSNTVQLGARAELFFGVSAFKVEGHLAFDALFQFNPFFFIIEISSGVSVKVFGVGLFSISLQFALEGPTPWRAKGHGKIKILFFSVKVNFDLTWGEKKDTTLPPIEVLPLLVAELAKLSNWKVEVPAANALLVSLRDLPEGDGDLVLHPVGSLSVAQRVVPLDITIDKVGNQKASDGKKFSLEVAGGMTKMDDLEEPFAIAQFQDFKDADKLSKPAFQPENAGIEFAVSDKTFATGKAIKRNVRYETKIIDTNFRFLVIHLFGFVGRLFNLFLGGNAVTKAEISNHMKKQFQPFDDRVVVSPDSYVVAFNTDNKAINGQAVFTSEAKAREFMNEEIAKEPALSETLHVIPAFELSEAA